MYSESQFNIPTTTSFLADIDNLRVARKAITDNFTDIDWKMTEPVLTKVDLRSDAAFIVKFNSETELEAVSVGSLYVVQYEGIIEYIKFKTETTLNFFWCVWHKSHKDHYDIEVASEPAGATITVKDRRTGNVIAPYDTNKYYLTANAYTFTVSKAGHETKEYDIVVLNDGIIKVGQGQAL